MESLVLCYARQDQDFALYLATFLENNLPLTVSCGDAIIGPQLDMIEATDRALSAEAALVVLSPFSVPRVWNRKTWEPVFFGRPKEFNTLLGFVLAGECKFPELLRRERFFDASAERLAAAREIKRWLLRPLHTAKPVAPGGQEFENLRCLIADRPGSVSDIAPDVAVRFAEQFAGDFDAVFRLDCRGRSRAGMVGDIGSIAGLRMNGRVEDNRAVLDAWCEGRRTLFLLSGVGAEDRDFMELRGRASVIFTESLSGCQRSGAAEAVRKFEEALARDVEEGLRLGWMAVNLLKAEERVCEVLEALDAMAEGAAGSRKYEQALVRLERERFWIRDALGYDEGQKPRWIPLPKEQLDLPFGN